MDLWQQDLSNSLTTPRQLAQHFPIDIPALEQVCARYPLRISPHYLGLIERPGDPIWRQCVPDVAELDDRSLPCDPLNEESLSPVPALVHRYPDRALLLASGACAVYCRFCTRKRKVGCSAMNLPAQSIFDAIDYIERTKAIRDVLISGGDPLLLSDELLGEMLERLRRIKHVEIIRIGSRLPVTLPSRITSGLCALLRRSQPLYLNTHFNHPRELAPEAMDACVRLADAGVQLGNQTVLLKGVNDDEQVMAELFRGLLRGRLRPYYLHQMDLTAGTGHFRTPVETGIGIIRALRGRVSGMAIPHYVIDLPGGKGKVPLLPEYLKSLGETLEIVTPDGERVLYPNLG